ncbi:hypothetical protein D3C76_1721830 [compost metagenome]
MTVIKDVPLAADINDAPVIVAAIIHWLVGRFVCIYMQIAITYNYPLINEAFRRVLADRIA